MDNNRLLDKHRKELGERVKYNQNHMRKFEREQNDEFEEELKRFQQEQSKHYKIKKETMKKVLNADLVVCFSKIVAARVSLGNAHVIGSIEERNRGGRSSHQG